MLRSSLMYFSLICFFLFSFLLSKCCASPLLCNIKIQFSQVTNGYSILLNIVISHVIALALALESGGGEAVQLELRRLEMANKSKLIEKSTNKMTCR